MSFSLLRRVLPPRPVLASDALHIVRWKSSRNAVEMDPEEYKEEAKKAKKYVWSGEGSHTSSTIQLHEFFTRKKLMDSTQVNHKWNVWFVQVTQA